MDQNNPKTNSQVKIEKLDNSKTPTTKITYKLKKLKMNKWKTLKENKFELFFILIFLGFILYSTSIFEGGQLNHETPYQFVAGDMFWLLNEAENIKDSNFIFDRLPPYTHGETLLNYFPFFQPLLVAQLSHFTGLQTHDALFHMNLFLVIFQILLVYLIFRKLNKKLAILSIPLTLFAFTWPFNFNITWGMQMSNLNFFLVLIGLLIFLEFEKKYMFILLGIINAAGIFTHTRETIVFNLGLLLFFLISVLKRKFNKQNFKKYLYSLLITLIIISYFLPILLSFTGGQTTLLKYCPANTNSIHYLSLTNFSFLKYLIYGGILLSIFLTIKTKNNTHIKILSFAYILLFARQFCFIGNKTNQIAHFTYLLIPIFAGLLLITLFKTFKLNNKIFIILTGLALLLLTSYLIGPLKIPPAYTVSPPETWDSFKWIQNNTAKNSTLLFLYGDNFYQNSLFYGPKRIQDNLAQSEFYKTIQTNQLSSEFRVDQGILGYKLNKKNIFKIEREDFTLKKNTTICDYNYVYFNKLSQQAIVQQYITELEKILITELEFEPVFENSLVKILKNPKIGGDCFEKRTFIE